jgi:cyanophycinase
MPENRMRKKTSSRPIAGSLLAFFFALILLIGPEVAGHSASHTMIGPAKGWLVLHGGGIGVEKPDGPRHRFAALAGGPKGSVVIVLTSIDLDVITPDFLAKYKQWWADDMKVTDLTFMDTRDRHVADTDTFVEPLRRATGVWIDGGHLGNLLESYLDTRTEREIEAVAERGGVIGGSSAGAMIQGSFLINVTKSPGGMRITRTGMYLDNSKLVGFGVLKNVTVYPHLTARGAQRDVAEVIAHHPELLGIGIDEDTAIIVHEDQFEVFGSGHVDIFDSKSTSGKNIVTLSAGQKFDLEKRLTIN